MGRCFRKNNRINNYFYCLDFELLKIMENYLKSCLTFGNNNINTYIYK